MNWLDCPDAERNEGKVSGAWLVKGSRVPVASIVEHGRAGYSAEEIAEIFEGVPVERVRAVLRFVRSHEPSST